MNNLELIKAGSCKGKMMRKRKAKAIITAAVLTCLIWFSPVVAQEVIILPPDVNYVNPCETTDQYDAVYAGLGKNIYFNMKSSIEKFNNLRKARERQIQYKAVSIVSACCRDNWKIDRFYENVKSHSEKLEKVCEKHQSDLIVWAEFEPDYKKKLIESFQKKKDCFIGLNLSVYIHDGPTRSKAMALKYKHDFNTFSGKTQKAVADALVDLLKGIHFRLAASKPDVQLQADTY